MVNFASILSGAVAASSLIGCAVAHPGEKHDMAHVKRQIDARQLRAAAAKRSLESCQDSLQHRSLMQRSHARRSEALSALRQKRGINGNSKKFRRDLALLQEFEAINHNQTGVLDYSPNTDVSTIFAANTSCILTPEVTDGPYYVNGELIRKDVKEGQQGIDLYLEVQYVDITTCQPVPELFVDVWNCNATGYYSGVESGQGGLNTTFLRGIQETDEDGVVAFETIFPGHYDGRAIHTHLLTKSNVTVRENQTTQDGAVTHIGQLFWPEELRSEVEATSPYNENTQAITSNDDDMWSIVQAENDYDPLPQFVYVGGDITDGLFAWIQIGVNASADYTDDDYYNVAATYQAGGGVANADSGMVGGGGAGGNGTMGGNGTTPSGSPPSGAIPSSTASA
ncbi:aromatic compound dioxygenase [Macroventuria anomochaeta]|uniref:Aromatic compound dioxygenase n=1 Tax=Macroventuria anomochaeta TaxID=301207 RepID=A0ACB6RUP8_9PLEO|nr:aromatic compound dioxygenase [Macroventuria anomochaeta]KAF2625776.1 aromatic compound dioxygenase [Macroventuria anomochaeta]